MWNNPNDPMPIKTTNMAGLQKWEETEDYCIYICKDAIMTTVEKYVTGSYQTFLERKADIESSQELLRSYSIEWSTQDSIDLINEINNEALTKLEATPMLLTENGDNKIQVLSARAVPVTYECCFRMDKKSGEIYIGEGYENLWKNQTVMENNNFAKDSDGKYRLTSNLDGIDQWMNYLNWVCNIKNGEKITYNMDYRIIVGSGIRTLLAPPTFSIYGGNSASNTFVDTEGNITFQEKGEDYVHVKANFTGTAITDRNTVSQAGLVSNYYIHKSSDPAIVDYLTGDYWYKPDKLQITKTNTPKPFVKSVMPSGKLNFDTDVTSETHSFIIKRAGSASNKTKGDTWYFDCGNLETFFNYDSSTATVDIKRDVLISKNFLGLVSLPNTLRKEVGQAGVKGITFSRNKRYCESIYQLLFYKANLTETELKSENSKDIKLATNNTQMHTQI